MAAVSLNQEEEIRKRFQRLIEELLEQRVKRNSFQPWEIDLLIDIDQYHFPRSLRTRLLQRYERAVLKSLAKGIGKPFLFSQYLATTWLGRTNPYLQPHKSSSPADSNVM